MVTIKHLKIEDLEKVGEIYADAFTQANIGEIWTAEEGADFMRYWVKRTDLFYVAKEDGKIVGGIVGDVKPFHGEKWLFDIELFILPDHQKQGIGKQLLKKIVEEAKSKYQADVIMFQSDPSEEFPINWYKKLGMQPMRWVCLHGYIDDVLKNLGD